MKQNTKEKKTHAALAKENMELKEELTLALGCLIRVSNNDLDGVEYRMKATRELLEKYRHR